MHVANGEISVKAETTKKPSVFLNWISLAGVVLSACAFFAVLFLVAMDLMRGSENPYMGILTYVVAPSFLTVGLILIGGGALWERRRRHHLAPGEVPRFLRIDFNIPHHRNVFLSVTIVTVIFLLMTAFGSYQTYHFTESVQFCGQTCHEVMKPEFTAYQNSPHARVACAECHIGEGAGWFVKSKLSGSYQVYSVMADKYPRPIPTPIHNLRPAQETCEQCHWPQKFFGNAERVNRHYLFDETNSPWTVTLLMKIGGGDPSRGPVGGIHWHMNVGHTVEYIASDSSREKIPWVRVTDPNGHTTVYEDRDAKLTPAQIAASVPRRVDCVDCHNRPAHNYNAPAKMINIAMSTGRISTNLPSIKKNAVDVLIADYPTTSNALTSIAAKLTTLYQNHPDPTLVRQAVAETQKIYSQNFFPEMKVNWRAYPDHIGHTIFPGCFRCHDGKHQSPDGKLITRDCNACHTITRQGLGSKAALISPQGLEFEHPTDIGDMWKEMNCHECHTGGAAP